MHRGHRVIAFIPYGRRQTVEILFKYLLKEYRKGILDELMLCMNTDPEQTDDVKYAKYLARQYKKFVKLYDIPGPTSPPELEIPPTWRKGIRSPKQMNTGRFYVYMQDRNAVYLRFDDDIVWIHRNAIKTLVDKKLDHPEYLAVFPTIINNSVSSYFLQQNGHVPYQWGVVGRGTTYPAQVSAVDPIGWADPFFAEKLHDLMLHHIEHKNEDAVLSDRDLVLGWRQQFSVSCFAVHGNDYADVKGILDWDEEEHWLTCHRTGLVGRSNIVCGQALVSHLTFFTQRDYILNNTNILDRYRALSKVYK